MIEHALAWADRGWRVLPVVPRDKRPLIREWETQATTDHDQIRLWWTRWPDANIGGLCGDDWLVVDVDTKNGKNGAESIERLQADYESLPATREHATPSGGWHYVYRRPANWAASKVADLPGYPGIDIQVGAAMVVLPPSWTPQGSYEVRADREIASGPLWLMTARVGITGRGSANPQPGVADLGEVMHQRDNQLYRLASLLRRQGHSAKAVTEQLRSAADSPMYPLHGPKPEHDIARIVKSAFRHPGDLFTDLSPIDDSDRANGGLLSTLSAGEVLWNDHHGSWFEWTGTHWQKSGYRLRQLTAEAIEALWAAWHVSLDDDERKKIVRRIRTLSTWSRLASAWEFLKGDVWVVNDEFDADPWLLNCPNGTVNLNTGQLREHRPADRITHVTKAKWDPNADMSEWVAFVRWCCKGDEQMVRWLQLVLGQALVGRVSDNLLLFLYGRGNNGKSVLIQSILKTIGTYGHEAPVGLIAVKGRDSIHDEYLVALQGRRLVVCPEPSRGTHWADGLVKQLTGGDGIPCRPNYGKPMTLRPTFLLVVHGNHQPEVRDRSEGFQRRLQLVPFDARVRPDQRVTNLEDVLAGPGVLRWLVEGAQAWPGAVPVCARVEAASNDYLTEGNQVMRFMSECLDVGDIQRQWTSTADIYAVYRGWCSRNGESFVENTHSLVEQMRMALQPADGEEPLIKAHTRERGGRKLRGWDGVGLTGLVEPLDTI